jgi:hypothetical protein
MIQYSAPAVFNGARPGVLDARPAPVIGFADGETRWRGNDGSG